MTTKPIVTGHVDGNIFAVLGAASKALKNAGMRDKAKEMSEKVFKADSYDQALTICMEYVQFELDGEPENDEDDFEDS